MEGKFTGLPTLVADTELSASSRSMQKERQHRRIGHRRLRKAPFVRAISKYVKVQEVLMRLERQRNARLLELETDRQKMESERLRLEAARVQLDQERLQIEAQRVRIEEDRVRTEAERQQNQKILSDNIKLLNDNLAFIMSLKTASK